MKVDQKDKIGAKVIKSSSEMQSSQHLSTSESITSMEVKREFKLAPTPAQLGKAPLQRRQSLGKKFFITILYDFVLNIFVAIASTSNQLPMENIISISSTEENSNENILSPVQRKSFFKKSTTKDGMDR